MKTLPGSASIYWQQARHQVSQFEITVANLRVLRTSELEAKGNTIAQLVA